MADGGKVESGKVGRRGISMEQKKYAVGISIIIPAYNASRYIPEMLDSILAQTFTDFEVIVINDGSRDDTLTVLQGYEARTAGKIRAYTTENRGQSAARNTALQYVRGKYIAFVDADDVLAPDYLKDLWEACEEKQANIAVTGFREFSEEPSDRTISRLPSDWKIPFPNGRTHVFIYPPWAKLLRTDFVMKHGFVFSEGEQMEDPPYGMMSMLLAGDVAVVDHYGYLYRKYPESTMGKTNQKKSAPNLPYRGILAAINKVREFEKDEETEKMLEYCTIKLLAGFVTTLGKSINTETRKKLCEYSAHVLDTCFPAARKNPYLSLRSLPRLPLSHRAAVLLFMIAYRLHQIYAFSWIAGKLLS